MLSPELLLHRQKDLIDRQSEMLDKQSEMIEKLKKEIENQREIIVMLKRLDEINEQLADMKVQSILTPSMN